MYATPGFSHGPRGTSIAAGLGMPTDLEQLLRDVFGESINRFNTFQADQMKRLQAKLQELAREALKEELTRMQSEINDLRARVATLEAERVQAAADQV
jgi:uncharacterized protein YPO0396